MSRRFGSSLEAYLKAKLERERRAAERDRVFNGSITVSRQAGCRALEVCELLATKLHQDHEGEGWVVHDKEIVEHIIEDNHLASHLADHLAEEKPHAVSGFLAEVFDMRPSDWSLFENSVDTVRKLARMGEAIIIGRGANFMTADMDNCFSVRLIGNESERLEAIRESRELDEQGAKDYLRRVDRDRMGYVRSHLHADASEPLSYHAVLNTDGASVEQLARAIEQMYLAWRDEHVAARPTAGAAV